MTEAVAILLTDIVDSTALSSQHGDVAMASVWAAHDRVARDLLRLWRGREIDKSDGFLLLFTQATDALNYVLAYHRALAALTVPLKARSALHVGQITMRENSAEDVALGAKPLEVDGVGKPVAARLMSAALGGQTLLTRPALDALGAVSQRVQSHGHWRVKGLPMPIECFEVGEADAPFTPPPDSAKVFRVVKQGELWLPVRELRHTLPAERDAFVGRRSTLQDLSRRFDGGARLVSLLGIGGCGKTRLATRFGWAFMGEYPGGVWFCDLAAARTLDGLVSAVAQGLQVPLSGEDPIAQLDHALSGRGVCLVILDNFEQLARHAEATLGRWLERAAEARFLVTTREVLGIAGEETLALAPLQPADAQALFMRRAAAARRDFKPTAEDEAAIAPLVKLLDGLPLAIELAAARVRTLAPRALLARMSERFKLLASSGGRHDRQATLRATFDWSWDLLPAADKAALAQLSVFEGGFTLEAAEAVIDLAALPDAPWTVDVVQSLVDKSFVRPLGDERFDLLVSVQAYAAEHLHTEGRYAGSGPVALAAALARHGEWFAGFGPQRATEQACADLDNLVAACRRAAVHGDSATAARTLDGAWAALSLRGPFSAGLALAEQLATLAPLADADAAHLHAVWGAALEASGQRAQAMAHYEDALQFSVAAADPRCEAAVLVRLGGMHARQAQPDRARVELARALALARELGDGAIECAALNGQGGMDFVHGLVDAANEGWSAAVAVAKRIGDKRLQGTLMGNLGSLHANQGRTAEARVEFEGALANARAIGDTQREGTCLSNLGMLHYLQGRLAEAAVALEAAHRVSRELGHPRLECAVSYNLGLVYAAGNQLLDALVRYDAALLVARRIGDRRAEGQILGHLGLAHARMNSFDLAREHLAAGEALLREAADGLSLGLLLCCRAEADCLQGRSATAASAYAEARDFASAAQAGPSSEIGQALARLATLVEGAPA